MCSLNYLKTLFSHRGKFLFLVMATWTISIASMAQSIQFGSGRITIRKAIETIESQTRYRISYNNSKLDVNQEIQTTVMTRVMRRYTR